MSTIQRPDDGAYFFFRTFEFSGRLTSSIEIFEDISIVQTPMLWLKDLKGIDAAMMSQALPGFGVGYIPNVCLHRKDLGKEERAEKSNFWIAVAAFRLFSPFAIRVSGELHLGSNGSLGATLPHERMSPWFPPQGTSHSFTRVDLPLVATIASRFDELLKMDAAAPRIHSASWLFTQITTGTSNSYQLTCLGLFAILEALFDPQGYGKGGTMAARVGAFLSDFQSGWDIESFIAKEYVLTRHYLSHGAFSPKPNEDLSPQKAEVVGRLHEIVRLSLLGFMGLTDIELQGLFSRSSKKNRTGLAALGKAQGQFLNKQKMWL
jgi:hypothetical protein